MIDFLCGVVVASLIAGALALRSRRRWMEQSLPRLTPGEHVTFYDPHNHRRPLATMVIESYDQRFNGPTTMAMVDWVTFVSRNHTSGVSLFGRMNR